MGRALWNENEYFFRKIIRENIPALLYASAAIGRTVLLFSVNDDKTSSMIIRSAVINVT
ncbi:MAG: hypothetical protein GX192_04120 [Clostridiales bacterium]|nr:hypothetical protein [Clostridiales bacterium]